MDIIKLKVIKLHTKKEALGIRIPREVLKKIKEKLGGTPDSCLMIEQEGKVTLSFKRGEQWFDK
ncbi:MAG: hypothetical protein FWG55_01555 [Candidatus Bathyarchaeota archaeon]|nr:hypothetical protein [Candidatus Termiticorpusculum sp.]